MTKSRNQARLIRHSRIRQKIKGTKSIPRLCVFKSHKHIQAQIIDDQNHHTLIAASSLTLKLPNGANLAAASAVGKQVASAALKLKISQVVFDRGGYLFHGRVKALAQAARQEGLKF